MRSCSMQHVKWSFSSQLWSSPFGSMVRGMDDLQTHPVKDIPQEAVDRPVGRADTPNA
jgi:hypothetical protein